MLSNHPRDANISHITPRKLITTTATHTPHLVSSTSSPQRVNSPRDRWKRLHRHPNWVSLRSAASLRISIMTSTGRISLVDASAAQPRDPPTPEDRPKTGEIERLSKITTTSQSRLDNPPNPAFRLPLLGQFPTTEDTNKSTNKNTTAPMSTLNCSVQ